MNRPYDRLSGLSHEEYRAKVATYTAVVNEGTGVEGHAIRCGWAVLTAAGLASPWTRETALQMVGTKFQWLRWTNIGAIVEAEPLDGGDSLMVEVWAVPA